MKTANPKLTHTPTLSSLCSHPSPSTTTRHPNQPNAGPTRPPPPHTQIFSFVRGGGGGVAANLVLLLSEVTGFYAMSTLLLIRKNVPMKFRRDMDLALGGELNFQFFHRWGWRGRGGVNA